MALRPSTLDASLDALDQQLAALPAGSSGGAVAGAIARFRADAAALRFHLRDPGDRPPIVAILGGTGTGKSTILNRLVRHDLSAANFRRTFTAGAIAVPWRRTNVPHDWLGVKQATLDAEQLPARGEADRLLVVPFDSELTRFATPVDTPDLDGDQPTHHAQADRAFRWADAVLFLVTPEKYQMIELVPYYRLAKRYALPAVFVMNKVEEQAVVDDYQARLGNGRGNAFNRPTVYAIPRDDSTYQPSSEIDLDALRRTLSSLPEPDHHARQEGLRARAADLYDRFHDQVLAPLHSDRREIDRIVAMLRALEAPPAEIDVNPITRQLARRLQQRSILYLMGPGRVLDRVRQVPALLARLPRTAWDLVMHGKADVSGNGDDGPPREVPDFGAILAEQLAVVQSRIDDVIRSSSTAGPRWIESDPTSYAAVRIDPARASAIATGELDQLRAWLESKWNATPRDTAVLEKVLHYLPGGKQLTRWSEAAPYLLTVVVATHHAFFGHVDLLILGGYSLAAWLTERLSNEVAARTRQANRAIADRFEQLAHEQIDRAIAWLEQRAPTSEALLKLQHTAEALHAGE
jgi:hypothetical protein